MVELPEALQPFAAYNQFIIHHNKVPTHPQTGLAHNPHDPAIWMTADAAIQAAALGYGVGFVFTAADPFFFLDIDGALGADGQWSQLSKDLCARFTGCAIEVSQSGKGLHIFGRYDAVPEHACKNIPLGLELYTDQRFVALTGSGAVGSASHTPDGLPALIAEYFPPSAPVAGADWTDGPCEGYGGPADDEELIRRMLASRSASGIFSGKASVADLWTADEAVLAASYPSSTGDVFDRSSADAALCQHLAFWTGKDCERIDRLFRRSALLRDKWTDREYYQRKTIEHAVGHCGNTLGSQQAAAGTAPDSEDGMRSGFQYAPVTQQLEHFEGCVYTRDLHRVFTPDGALLKPDQFRAMYGGYVFALDSMNDKTSKNAWEVFTESQAVRFPKVHNICFRPERPPGTIITEEGQTLINTYIPAGVEHKDGDPTRFLELLARILPDDRDRAIVLAYMAACVQYPGVKFQWAPLLQGVQGNGKSTLMTVVAKAVGGKYTHKPPASDISNVFNAWIVRKLFIAVEEVYVADRREVIDALKIIITEDRVPVTPKGVDQQMGDNRANLMMASNHRDAYRKTADDRRVAMFFTAQQDVADLKRDGMDGSYFPDLYAWLRADGFAIVAKYLSEYRIPDALNPATSLMRAPDTSSTGEALEASLGSIEQEVLEAVDEGRQGFAGGWISSMAFDTMLSERRGSPISRNKRKELLESLGYVPHPALSGGRVNSVVMQEGGKPRLYIKEGHIAANNLRGGAEVLMAYLKDHGYAEGVGGVGVVTAS